MHNQFWLVRECPEGHGLISVDEEDLDTCPAPADDGSGQCGAVLSKPFVVKRTSRCICTIGGCGATFANQDVLDHHMAKPHIPCPDCPRQFTVRGLGKHRQAIHPPSD